MRHQNYLRKKVKALFLPLTSYNEGHRPDYILLIIVGIVIFLGLLMLSSATSVLGFDEHEDSYYFLKQQLLRGLIPGLILFFFFIRVNFGKLKKYSWLWLLLTILLLLVVFIPNIGVEVNGAKSWINFFGISIQTSEIAKLTFIIYLAIWLDAKEKNISNPRKVLLPFMILLGIICSLILMQPDMGTMTVFVLFSVTMLFVAGVSIKHLALLLSVAIASIIIMIKIAPYRSARLTSFVNPEADPQGQGYQLLQALIAVGSGGLWGLGLGQSVQKFSYLPEVAADSIFAIIAEEWGFILASIFVLLYFAIFLRGIHIAKNAPDLFSKLLATGITCWVVLQSFVNIAAIIGIMPLTGLPLPFVSLGGSNLAILMSAIAILINISKFTKAA